MAEVILFGEPMALFSGLEYGELKDVATYRKSLAGAELNVCIGLTRLGHATTYITKLGAHDPFGAYIYRSLENAKIDVSNVSFDEENLTGFMLKTKAENGDPDIFYFRRNSAASHIGPEDIDRVSLEQVRHVHLTGIPCALSESCLAASRRLIERAHAKGIYVSFDPNLRPSLWKSREIMARVLDEIACSCDMVMPGFSEGRVLTGFDTPEQIADYYLSKGVRDIIIKTGRKGAYVQNREMYARLPSFPVEKFARVVDTVGAGDGFAVGVISGRLENMSLEESAARGNVIGGLQLTVPGDNEGLPTREELQQAILRGAAFQ